MVLCSLHRNGVRSNLLFQGQVPNHSSLSFHAYQFFFSFYIYLAFEKMLIKFPFLSSQKNRSNEQKMLFVWKGEFLFLGPHPNSELQNTHRYNIDY